MGLSSWIYLVSKNETGLVYRSEYLFTYLWYAVQMISLLMALGLCFDTGPRVHHVDIKKTWISKMWVYMPRFGE